jgi:hypothetical protein
MEVRQEEDLLPGRMITLAALFAVVLTLILAAWARTLLGSTERELRPSGKFPERSLPAPNEVSAIEQHVFTAAATEGAGQKQAAERRLSSYGWVDRGRGVVHVPIERAIDLYVAEEGGP